MSSDATKRKSEDRRNEDIGPPNGWRDRRRTVERRLPAVEEAVISDAEWHAYFVAGKRAVKETVDIALGESNGALSQASAA